MAAAIRSDDPVVFFEHKGLFASKGEPAPPDHVVELGKADVVREGTDVTLVALASTVPTALAAAERWPARESPPRSSTCGAWSRWTCTPCSPRSSKTSRLVTVEENPYQGGWGATRGLGRCR